MEAFWHDKYPKGVVNTVDSNQFKSMPHFFDEAFATHAKKEFCTNMGVTYLYEDIEAIAHQISCWLQNLNLPKGSRVALMMPNINQYLPILIGTVRTDCVLTTVNPMYTPRELEYQLNHSEAAVIFILEPFCHVLEKVIHKTKVKHVVISTIGDMLGSMKGNVVNLAAKYVKKAIPKYTLKTNKQYQVTSFKKVLKKGKKLPYTRPVYNADDMIFLQYTGGTTGVAKGIMITHRNILTATLQFDAWFAPALGGVEEKSHQSSNKHGVTTVNTILALPLYHIFAFIMAMLGMRVGQHFTLITNPRDIDAFVKTLAERPFHVLPAVNTLFQALLMHPEFKKLDFSPLAISLAGGMAATPATAKKWLEVTGSPIIEGWGMSETVGAGTANPINNTEFSGDIGMPLPSIDISIRDDDDNELGIDEVGELCIKGDNVINSYYNIDNTKFFTQDGYLKTGDVASINSAGHIKLYDRKKDMLIVSGFNVFPNEIEGVIGMHPKVAECAVVGVDDELQGQKVKAFVVKADASLTKDELKSHCKENLTGYKRPSIIEFVEEIPKSTVGKILRHKLRD